MMGCLILFSNKVAGAPGKGPASPCLPDVDPLTPSPAWVRCTLEGVNLGGIKGGTPVPACPCTPCPVFIRVGVFIIRVDTPVAPCSVPISPGPLMGGVSGLE